MKRVDNEAGMRALPRSRMTQQRLGWAAVPAIVLAGCAASSPPPLLLHLPAGVPAAAAQAPVATATAAATTYQLMLPVRLPDYLDRAELLVPQGAVLSPMPGVRWAEPLREAVPRLLRADLAALLGPGRLWSAPLPPGVAAQRQLRVEITAFEADAARSLVRLRASWSDAATTATMAPTVQMTVIEVAATDNSAPALATAHRQVLWELARRIAATAR